MTTMAILLLAQFIHLLFTLFGIDSLGLSAFIWPMDHHYFAFGLSSLISFEQHSFQLLNLVFISHILQGIVLHSILWIISFLHLDSIVCRNFFHSSSLWLYSSSSRWSVGHKVNELILY